MKTLHGCLYGLALSSNGAVVVSDWKQNKLIMFDKRMKYQSTIASTSWYYQYDDCFNKPSRMASVKMGTFTSRAGGHYSFSIHYNINAVSIRPAAGCKYFLTIRPALLFCTPNRLIGDQSRCPGRPALPRPKR